MHVVLKSALSKRARHLSSTSLRKHVISNGAPIYIVHELAAYQYLPGDIVHSSESEGEYQVALPVRYIGTASTFVLSSVYSHLNLKSSRIAC